MNFVILVFVLGSTKYSEMASTPVIGCNIPATIYLRHVFTLISYTVIHMCYIVFNPDTIRQNVKVATSFDKRKL